MEEMLERLWFDLIARVHGPLKFRLVLQPLMAMLLAIRAGVQDAHNGRPPYLWTILTDARQRRQLLLDGWKADMRVLLLALAMDGIYQLFMLHWVYPLEMVIVAISLAVLPYLVMRGPANRFARYASHAKAQRRKGASSEFNL